MNLLFLGGGNMGAAIASGALDNLAGVTISVVDPNVEMVRIKLPHDRVEVYASLDDLPDTPFDLSLLAVKPQIFKEIPEAQLAKFTDSLIVSIMAGVTVAEISRKTGSDRVVRTMPNLPALVGQAMTVGVAGGNLSQTDNGLVTQVFESIGSFAWLEREDQIDSVTAVAGSGPGYAFAFAHYMIEAAIGRGLSPKLADQLVRQTFYGASLMLKEDQRSAFELKQAVTSKAGTTEAGLNVFEAETGLPQLCTDGVTAAEARAKELSKL